MCDNCNNEPDVFNGIPSLHKISGNGKLKTICHPCHVKKMKCYVCGGYAPHGVKMGRFSEILVCEECLEKIENSIKKNKFGFLDMIKTKNM